VATQLLDVFGFLSVLLRGGALASSALVLGGAIFVLWVCPRTGEALQSCRRLLWWSAGALAVVQLCYVAADSAILAATAGLPLRDIAGANFFLAGVGAICAAAAIGALARRTGRPAHGILIPAAVVVSALIMTSHAAGRVNQRPLLIALTALHLGAAAAWVGAMPYFLLAIARSGDAFTANHLCRSFSRLALTGVAVLAGSGIGLSMLYVGSPHAIYGTSYGAMVASKVVLLGLLLLPGGFNYLIVRQHPVICYRLLPSLRRFAEAEVGIGFTVILAAASLTSQPPAVDMQAGRLTAAEIAQRMSPGWPQLHTPPLDALSPATPLGFGATEPGLVSFVPGTSYHPNTPGDIAWSEYNHHWSGLIVMVAGLAAVLASLRVRWARHWPLAFLGLAVFLFLRSDPENWPLGPRSFWQSFAVAEVLQHRVFVVLIVAFAYFEWAVRTGRISSHRASLVFPAVCAAGGALLLTHSHALGNIKEELLAELSHIPLAILAVAAGWSRWLELRLAIPQRRMLAWVWPVCLVLIGAVLLNYREA
jgi:putative copper resistance protein D